MKTLLLMACLGLVACGDNAPLYPGLTLGQCAKGTPGKHTVYDFMGIPECVPNEASAERHSSRWLD